MSDLVRTAAANFFNIFEEDPDVSQNRESRLSVLLDQLALAAQFPAVEPHEDMEQAPEPDEDELREKVEALFPSFSYYNLPLQIHTDVGDSPVGTADPVEDLVEIYKDVFAVAWHFENTDAEAATWLLTEGYTRRWGKNLRALQLYLFCLLTDE